MSIPDEIYLQHGGDSTDDDWPQFEEDLRWCREQINESDIRYIRADTQPAAPEPDWNDAPEWAQWWAVNSSGMTQLFFESKPNTEWGEWFTSIDVRVRSERFDLPLGVDWRTTLRKRPE